MCTTVQVLPKAENWLSRSVLIQICGNRHNLVANQIELHFLKKTQTKLEEKKMKGLRKIGCGSGVR